MPSPTPILALPAQTLAITEAERDALLWFAQHGAELGPERFDMSKPCGSCCCIGGHVALIIGRTRDFQAHYAVLGYNSTSLTGLYYPDGNDTVDAWFATSTQAAHAVRLWLTGHSAAEAWTAAMAPQQGPA